MTGFEIFNRCQRIAMQHPDTTFAVTPLGEACLQDDFSTVDDEEPHDIAFDLVLHWQEILGEIGLSLANWESDNDSIWGKIVEKVA